MNSVKNNNESSNGLEDLEIPGQVYLRDALTSCTDPLKAIEQFQVNKTYILYQADSCKKIKY